MSRARFLRISPLFLCFSLFVVAACTGEENVTVMLAAKPSNMVLGKKTVSRITANEGFFTRNIKTPLVSDKGLILNRIEVKDSQKVDAVFKSDQNTSPGLHTFEFNLGEKTAFLDISVILPDPGPGEVVAEGTEASSGVDFAVLRIHGEGTKFDDFCTVDIHGADGFTIKLVNVKSATEIEVVYSIDIGQEPTTAEITLRDGHHTYSFPFEIVDYLEFDNLLNDQFLVKGSEGRLYLNNEASAIGLSSTVFTEDQRVEFGDVKKDSESNLYVPIRVPFDIADDQLNFQLRSYRKSGSQLELLNVRAALLEPAFIVPSPAVLPFNEDGIFFVEIIAEGIDLQKLENISLAEDDQFRLVDFVPDSPSRGEATFEIGADAKPGVYRLSLRSQKREVEGVIVLNQHRSMKAYYLKSEIHAGDTTYLPISVQSGDLKDTLTLLGNDGVSIRDFLLIDQYSLVATVKSDPDTFSARRSVVLSGEEYDYLLDVFVVDSEL